MFVPFLSLGHERGKMNFIDFLQFECRSAWPIFLLCAMNVGIFALACKPRSRGLGGSMSVLLLIVDVGLEKEALIRVSTQLTSLLPLVV